jgi:trk system potassium uptake protein TrkH
MTLLITLGAYSVREDPFEQVFRDALFQVVSLITTTGFVSADYTGWATYLTVMCLALMFLGGSAGSTSGSIKMIRHYVMVKNGILEFKRLLHPRAIVPLTINSKRLTPNIVTNVLVFLILYLNVFVISTIIMSILGLDLPTSMGAVATTLGNVGPGIGTIGPMDNFSGVSSAGKWFLSFLMLVGRLELFTVLILFTPYFWRSN